MGIIYRVQTEEPTIKIGKVTLRYKVFKLDEDFEVGGVYLVHEHSRDGHLDIFCDCPSSASPCKHSRLVEVARGCYLAKELDEKFWTMEAYGMNIQEYELDV